MIKFLLGLITAVSSFVGLLGNANSALATPVVVRELEPVVNTCLEQPVNLNVSNSLWHLSDRDSKNIFTHLGCSCAACSQVEVNHSPQN